MAMQKQDVGKEGREQLQYLPIEFIERNPHQPRQHFEEQSLQELADSIAELGVLQPLIVRRITPVRYQLTCGERRWRACGLAGLYEAPCIVKSNLTDEQALVYGLTENVQREDLNPMDEAESLQRLLDEYGYTHETAASTIGKTRSYVSNAVRFLLLPEAVKNYLCTGDLESGHAKLICGIPKEYQALMAREVLIKHYSVRQLEQAIRKRFGSQRKKSSRPDPNITRLSQHIADVTGCQNEIEHQPNGAGRLVIKYTDLEQLEGLLRHLPNYDSELVEE